MKKIIIITFIFCISAISCGKKGDPVFKDLKKKVKILGTLTNKV